MVNFHEADSKKKPQTLRSLAHKLEQHPIWIDATKGFYEEDIEGCIYSWLSMSEDNKNERLTMTECYNFNEYFHNIIAKIEANMI
jgi:hypothetical protein